jgi:hypothetical protein
MNINLDHNGGVLIAFDDNDEAADFLHDLEDALASPGEDITSHLIDDEGVMTFTVRVNA